MIIFSSRDIGYSVIMEGLALAQHFTVWSTNLDISVNIQSHIINILDDVIVYFIIVISIFITFYYFVIHVFQVNSCLYLNHKEASIYNARYCGYVSQLVSQLVSELGSGFFSSTNDHFQSVAPLNKIIKSLNNQITKYDLPLCRAADN